MNLPHVPHEEAPEFGEAPSLDEAIEALLLLLVDHAGREAPDRRGHAAGDVRLSAPRETPAMPDIDALPKPNLEKPLLLRINGGYVPSTPSAYEPHAASPP